MLKTKNELTKLAKKETITIDLVPMRSMQTVKGYLIKNSICKTRELMNCYLLMNLNDG